MTHGSLFSGIGGFDLAAEWSGFTNLFNCEWEEFPRKVLKHHFPNAEQFGDIKDFNATAYSGRLDILSGGFPCQPFSVAGKRKGSEDERHLWPVWFELIKQCRPDVVFGEQVESAIKYGWLDLVQDDLEREKTRSSLATRVIQVERDMKDLEKRMVDMNTTIVAMWDNPIFEPYRSRK